MKHYDIVIIGAGLVGYSLVASLKDRLQADLKVAVIDSIEAPTLDSNLSPSFDDRSTALNAKSIQLLQQWQIWPHLKSYCCAIKQIEISDQGGLKTINLDSNDSGVDAFGYVAPNKFMGQALLSIAQKLPVDFYYGCDIKCFKFQAEKVIVSSQLETLSGSLIVLADGGRSEIKTKLGIQDDVVDFSQTAIVANIQTSLPNNHLAYERFADHGPMAMLPLSEKTSALVWSVDTSQAKEIMELDDQSFLNQAWQNFGGRLGQWQKTSKRSSYPLKRVKSEEMVRSRLILLGNSAATLHPVAGQGFNLALRAVEALANSIHKTESKHLGQLTQLLKVKAAIENDQHWTIRFCDELVNGFGHRNLAAKLGRAAAMGLFDQHNNFKGIFSRYAMGLGRGQ